jgi:hypothetical protein
VYTHEFNLYIVVFTIDIGVGVMSDVVFYLPEVYVSSQQVERIGQYIVHAFIVRKGVMSGIMHNIETDGCKIYSKQYT